MQERTMQKQEMIINPSKNFHQPKDILNCQTLTPQEKNKALLNWKSECVQIERAQGEGMNDQRSPQTPLKSVMGALEQLALDNDQLHDKES